MTMGDSGWMKAGCEGLPPRGRAGTGQRENQPCPYNENFEVKEIGMWKMMEDWVLLNQEEVSGGGLGTGKKVF